MTSLAERAAQAVEARIVRQTDEDAEKQRQRYCPWCTPTGGGAGYCVCDSKCGLGNCPYNEEVFEMPPVPKFQNDEEEVGE